jgi:hypothetical protein
MSLEAAVTLSVTIIVAGAGYLVTYLNNLALERRKARLDRVNRQLSDLYGPLYALSEATFMAWTEFRGRLRGPDNKSWPSTDEEKATWRLWMTEVLMPANEEMQRVVVHHSDLLRESTMPECLLDLGAHVNSYRTIARRWQQGDFRDHLALIPFPDEVRSYAKAGYLALKEEQAKLIGSTQGRAS